MPSEFFFLHRFSGFLKTHVHEWESDFFPRQRASSSQIVSPVGTGAGNEDGVEAGNEDGAEAGNADGVATGTEDGAATGTEDGSAEGNADGRGVGNCEGGLLITGS